jgi:PAS domain S-box-containing protein
MHINEARHGLAQASGHRHPAVKEAPVDLPAFVVHLKSARIICSNAPGLELLGLSGRDELAGLPLDGLFPGIAVVPGCRGSSWVRVPNGPRRYLRWSLVEIPDRAGEAVLVLDPDGRPALDSRIGRSLAQALEALEQGAAAAEVLCRAAGILQECLQLRLVRLLQLRDPVRELACHGEEQAAAAVRAEFSTPERSEAGVRAAGEGEPLLTVLDPGGGASWQAALYGCGLRGRMTWPLRVGGEVFLMELHVDGIDDLNEPTASAMLHHWLPWLERRLTHGGLAAGQRLAAEALASAASAAFITDTEGTIVWVNRAFTELYGHSEGEALGATPRLIRSGEHGPRYYRALWSALRSGAPWSGETVDRAADGREVIVHQTISPVRQGGRITHYLSIHADTTEQSRLRRLAERERGIDEISGLMTEAAFEERTRQLLCTAEESGSAVAWILCSVSNSFGHAPKLEAEALAYVRGVLGQRLREATDAQSVIGVLGPFDFTVLLHRAPLQAEAEAVARGIAESVCEPLPLLGDSLQLRCHTAIARFPADGGSVRELRLAADRRLASAEPCLAVFPAEAALRW